MQPKQEFARSRLNTDRDETLGRIAELERDFTAIVTSTREGSAGGDDEHDPEGATIAFERAKLASLLDDARATLAAVENALTRLREGSYETCERCGDPIAQERLLALPWTRTCFSCASNA
jgi:DnaK suppressor protein